MEYEISQEQMLEDYDNMWTILKEKYPYFDILKSRGVDSNARREIYRAQVEEADNFNDFYGILPKFYILNLDPKGIKCI